MKICVFCSANSQIDAAYFQLTEELGRWAARNGHVIVFGGVNQGLMECLAKAVKEAGGQTLGKQLMLDESDVFIALPGGVGTLDEVFTVAASYTIGYHQKRVILYNMLGFWDATIRMLDDLQQRGMVRGRWRDYICVANNLDEIEQLII